MKKELIIVFALFLSVSSALAQTSLNGYKYVIVPKKYEFLKENDKFELNSLTKFLFKKAGFETLLKGDDYPEDLIKNPCLAVLVDLKDNSSMFTTKVTIDLTDCYNKVVYTAQEGKSKEKDYKKTYQEALRRSFASIEALNYKYDSELAIKTDTKVKEEITQVSTPKKVEPKPAKAQTATVIAMPAPPIKVSADAEVNKESKIESVARSYKNDNISFFLIDQNNDLVAYVIESKIDSYKKGEMIGTFVKTSLPNVFKVSWKNKQEGIDETIAYFDEGGNLKIEINRNGEIEILVFKAEN